MELDLSKLIPRILSNIDTNPLSPTYGCGDKAYWWYKTKDFPNARLQEYIFTFAFLAAKEHPKNHYYNNESLKNLAKAGLFFLAKIQNSDGSFNEWYPYEHSFVATAFSMAKAADAFRLLRYLPQEEKCVISMFKSAASWLSHSKEEVSNQVAGAAYALLLISYITNDSRISDSSKEKLQLLMSKQTSEGWLPEYGGADFGYLQLLLDFLARYHLLSRDEQCLAMAKKGFHFLSHFIHPDGACGGVYGSRGTEFTFPFGAAYFSQFIPEAAYVHANIKTISPEIMDDNFALQYHDSALMAMFLPKHGICLAKKPVEKTNLFREAGLFVYNMPHCFMIINLKKGGVFALYSDDQIIHDAGIWARKNNRVITTQWMNSSNYSLEDGKIIVSGNFVIVPLNTISIENNVLLRMFGAMSPDFLLRWCKKMARQTLITDYKKSNIVYRRTITLAKKEVIVEDIIFDSSLADIKCLTTAIAQYVPTARFYSSTCLENSENEIKWQQIGNTIAGKRVIGI